MFDLLISNADFKKREGNVETYEIVKTGMLELLWLEPRRKSALITKWVQWFYFRSCGFSFNFRYLGYWELWFDGLLNKLRWGTLMQGFLVN